MNQKVMIVAAHPDDEILGAGGAIKRLIDEGCEVVSVILTKGRKEEEDKLPNFAAQANNHLGIKEVIILQLPTQKLDALPLLEIIQKLEALLPKYEPDIIFTHHYGDMNRDHRITFEAVMTAARPIPGKKQIEIICFETVSSSEWTQYTDDKTFKPNYYVNIEDTIEEKIKALQYYDIEMRPFPHPRSYKGIRFLARIRGMTVGVQYAEAFEIIRKIWK
ncbi:PIG-L deacetylase family protein [Paenibacillus spongiae]|uniref:PIG-L family deacetylase n=1 Tax=Paenibacillus spongiae TaxID=2909671 RepID=A0ABY5SAX8_9BACL|nr:PIG-L family deacetylase [Paenibacillus spongiae]UVI29685.1 PIG-L family deacetylase [Paenibacillus spongiae]